MDFGCFPDFYARFPALPAESRIGLIATIPRSGTWALQYFFSAFHSLVKGATLANPFDIAFSHLPEIGLDLFSIGHHYCPGLSRIGEPRFRQWQSILREPLPGWDWASASLERYVEHLRPDSASSVRLVLVYRNPLDQVVSFCRQMQRPYNAHYAGAIHADDGSPVGVGDIGAFLRRVGASNYLKYFLGDWWGREIWGERIKLVRYERLVLDREATLASVLEFLRGPLGAAEQDAFRSALAATSSDAMRDLEQRRNRSLGDPSERSEGVNHRHIVDGRAGMWREVLRPEDAEYCRALLAHWGIPDGLFRYEP